MKRFVLLVACAGAATTLLARAQSGLDPKKLLNPGTDSWPTYNGDYSGRRFSTLTRINANNVGALSPAWVYRLNTGAAPVVGSSSTIKSTPLQINGVLYFSTPDHAWAVDARTGREIWHYLWQSSGGNHLSNRGVAVLGESVYFETPDDNLVCLNIKDGKERWHKTTADLNQFYYSSTAPVIVKNHVITGVSGDDLDIPGYLDARDPETGELHWRWYTVPQKKGDPGFDTWPNEDMARHGGGMTWQPITHDPELNLIYVATGNPQPVMAHKNRPGANLFTESIVALNADTGKMVWYFQPSPHDTHDWDATEPAVLIDGTIDGRPRKLIAQASRNGHFFLLDRTDGKAIVSAEYVKTNWSLGYDEKGQPVPNPDKMPKIDGTLVSPASGGAANWQPSSFSPATGLFYVPASRSYSVYYLFDPSDNPQGWGGNERGGYSESLIQAIDYKTGKVRWSHTWEGPARSGLLSTAGNLLFGAGPGNSLVALNATTGDALWHARLNAGVSNGPITYELDGLQYLVVGASDTLWAFVMNR